MRKRNSFKAGRSSAPSRRKIALLLAAAGVAVYLLVSFIFGEMGVIKYYRMKSRYEALTEDIAALKLDNAKLQREVRSLRTDPACIERLARDELGLARPGEIVYYYKSR